MKRFPIRSLFGISLLATIAFSLGAMTPAASDGFGRLIETLALVSCTSLGPCQTYSNASTGPGIQGQSAQGKGVVGNTAFNSTSTTNGQVGVLGQDKSTSGKFDAGVKGTSKAGIGVVGTSTSNVGVQGTSATFFGVFGRSGSPSNLSGGTAGVYGDSSSQNGVIGTSLNGNGVFGESLNQAGVVAFSPGADGLLGSTEHNSTATGTSNAGVVGIDNSSDGGNLDIGVKGFSTNGIGIQATSTGFVGANVVGGFMDSSYAQYPALSVIGDGANAPLITACASGPAVCNIIVPGISFTPSVFTVSTNGNVDIAGTIATSGSCVLGCARTNSSGERRVRFFTPRESLPTVEDFGEGQLVNGQAYVRIDPAFANTIDPQTAYMVFITPEGDSRGLFVTSKSLTGFSVHENQGGRSTLAFNYRIVAKPFGEHPVKLQTFRMELPRARQIQPSRLPNVNG